MPQILCEKTYTKVYFSVIRASVFYLTTLSTEEDSTGVFLGSESDVGLCQEKDGEEGGAGDRRRDVASKASMTISQRGHQGACS